MNRGSKQRAFRRRAIGWIIALALTASAVTIGVHWMLSIRMARHVKRLKEPEESLELSRRIARFFADHRLALSEGLIDLDRPDAADLEGDLRVLERILDDDGLLEAEVHRRGDAVPGRRATYSAHEWLVGEESRTLRSRLPGLLIHPAQGVRALAASCLALLGEKLPEALASEPLPWFRREHLRGLLQLVRGNPPGPEVAVRSFLREVLRDPGSFRLWEKGPRPGRPEVLSLALLAVAGLEDPIEGSLAEAVRSLADLPVTDRVLEARILGRTGGPRTWPLLVQLASKDQPAAVRLEALASLKVSGPPEALHPLLELAAPGDSWVEKVRETLEHISGERMPENAPVRLEPGRLGALRGTPQTRADAARQVSALRFHGLASEPGKMDPEARRRIIALLASELRESRLEAARTAGRAGIVEAIPGIARADGGPPPPEPPPPSAGGLMGLVMDPDFRIASAAASALFEITGFWPTEERAGEAPEPGSLPLAAASDPARMRAWAASWQKWWAKEGGRRREDWLLDALTGGLPARATLAAREIATLDARGGIEPTWYQRNAARLLETFPRLPAEARAPLLTVLAAREAPARADVLWGLFAPAFRADPVAAWEVLGAYHAFLARGAAVDEKAALAALVARIGREDGSAEVLITAYLDARFPPARLDEALLASMRAIGGGAEKDAERARLVRFYPRAADRAKVLFLVDLLRDPGPRVRFWAFQRLSSLAGQGFGYDPQKPVADQGEAIGKFKAWAERF